MRPSRAWWTLGLILLVASAPAHALLHDDLPVVFEDSATGGASWGVRASRSGTGPASLLLIAEGPATTSRPSVGLAATDATGAPTSLFAIIGTESPNRVIATTGDLAPLAGIGGPRVVLDAEPDAACPYYCVIVFFDDAPAGTYYFVLWEGGLTKATLRLHAEPAAGLSMVAQRGRAWGLGDGEMAGGAPNVQVQQGPAGNAVGAKLVREAGATIDVQQRLYGFWQATDFKIVCATTCFSTNQVAAGMSNGCANAGMPVSCGNGQISWTGPGGSGQSGRLFYPLTGLGGGAYEFHVDLMADAYATRVVAVPGLVVFPLEYATMLAVADVAVPG